MIENKYLEALGQPFPASDIKWRFQYFSEEKLNGIVVPYLDARAIADRLDNVVGQNNWKDSYECWHEMSSEKKQKFSQLCTIYIYDDEKKEWIGKTDGAENSDIEPIKGGLSDAFKRAATKWNIGRYLYNFSETTWANAEKRGKSFVISEASLYELEQKYNAFVLEMFGKLPAGSTTKSGKQEHKQQSQKTQQSQQPQQKDEQRPSGQQNNTKTGNSPVYEIQQISVQNNERGSVSSIILSCGGNRYRAVMNGSDQRLQKGSKITNVNVKQCQNGGKTFNMIDSYDIAA